MKIKAKFIGKDGSLGYINGWEYELILTTNKHLYGEKIKIKRNQMGEGACIYGSVKNFLNNWTNIKTV